MAHAEVEEVCGVDLAGEGDGVERHDLLAECRYPTDEVERGADGTGHAARPHIGDLGGIDEVAMHPQAGAAVRLTAPAQQQHLGGRVRGPAGGAQQLRGRVAREHAAPLHQHRRGGGPQREVRLEWAGAYTSGNSRWKRGPRSCPRVSSPAVVAAEPRNGRARSIDMPGTDGAMALPVP